MAASLPRTEFTDLGILRCPDCRGELRRERGALACAGCGERWPERRGLPRLYREERVGGIDRFMRLMYNSFHRFHDPAVRHLLPLLDSCSEQELREGYMRRLDCASLRPHEDDTPVRILEVGIGAGANLPLLRRELPAGLEAEVWGLDLSEGMLGECRRKVATGRYGDVRLLMANAHALPFADRTFDRVFHVGGIGGFADPGLALAEMARVARPGTPVVVVDEQLDSTRPNTLFHRASFRLLTFYDRAPQAPTRLVPPGATEVVEEPVSRFYYCLSFRTAKGS